MIDAGRIPTTIVTGFLGSGKTTLLRHLIQRAGGRRLAVIVNEFGRVGVDGDLIRQCSIGCEDEGTQSGRLYELANGCLCCTVQDELLPVLETLLERRDRVDHILIETSGLALPKPLVQAFQWPEVRAACTVDAVVAVVDAPAVAAGQFASDPAAVDAARRADPDLDHERPLRELFEDQVTSADLVLLHKVDASSARALELARERVVPLLRPEVKIVEASHGRVAPRVVIGLGRASEDRIDERPTHHDAHHAAGRAHDHDFFDSVALTLGPLERDAALRACAAVLRAHQVYRAKGWVDVPGKPMRLLVQAVGARLDAFFDRPWRDGEARRTQMVWIGRHLDRDALLETFVEATAG